MRQQTLLCPQHWPERLSLSLSQSNYFPYNLLSWVLFCRLPGDVNVHSQQKCHSTFLKHLQFASMPRHGGLRTTGLGASEDIANQAGTRAVSSAVLKATRPSISLFSQAISQLCAPCLTNMAYLFSKSGYYWSVILSCNKFFFTHMLINCEFHFFLPSFHHFLYVSITSVFLLLLPSSSSS